MAVGHGWGSAGPGYLVDDLEQEMLAFVQRFAGDQSGATAIEYALIAAFIFVVIVSSVTTVGTSLNGTFTTVNAGFSAH